MHCRIVTKKSPNGHEDFLSLTMNYLCVNSGIVRGKASLKFLLDIANLRK